MTGVHRLQHVQDSPPSDLPTTVPHTCEFRTRSRILASPLPSRWLGLSRLDDVVLLQLELDRVSIVMIRSFGNVRRQHVQQGGLAGAGTAGDKHVQPRLDAGLQELGQLGRQVPNPIRSGP